MKKNFRVLCFSLAFGLLSSMTAFAEQSDRWYSDENGTWFLKNEAGTGNVVNSWFRDLDGSWYLLAPNDGHMYAGLIHDTLTDRWYYCQVEHDGYYGRMVHTDGVYTINNQQVYLTFNQAHDGTFGALTSNIDTLKSTGVPVVEVAGLPVESDTADSTNNQPASSGTLSDYDKQFDTNHDGVLDDNERISKKFLEEIAAGKGDEEHKLGEGTGAGDWNQSDTDDDIPVHTGGDRSGLDKQAEDLLADVDWSTGTSTGFDGKDWAHLWH